MEHASDPSLPDFLQFEEADLKPYMDQCGIVKDIMIIRDQPSGYSKGCAFVSYSTEDEAKRAIDMHDRKTWLAGATSPLEVRFARSHQFVQAGSGPIDNRKLFFARAPTASTSEDIRNVFSHYGKVEEVQVFPDWKAGGASKGCGFITMAFRDDALRAIQGLNEQYIMEGATNALVVQWADPDLQSRKKKAVEEADADSRMLFFAKVLRTAQESQIRALFSQYGSVHDVTMFRPFLSACITKGCGLVTMGTHGEACSAILALDGRYTWEGMDASMVVKWMDVQLQKRRKEMHQATKRKQLQQMDSGALCLPSSLGSSEASSSGQDDACKVYVGNLPRNITLEALRPQLEVYGEVTNLMMSDRSPGGAQGAVYAWYRTKREADRAICALHMNDPPLSSWGVQEGPLSVGRPPRALDGVELSAPRGSQLATAQSPIGGAPRVACSDALQDVPYHVQDMFPQQGFGADMGSVPSMEPAYRSDRRIPEETLSKNFGHISLMGSLIGGSSVPQARATDNGAHPTQPSLQPPAPLCSPGQEAGVSTQLTLAMSLSQSQGTMLLAHMFNIQTYSGACVKLSPGQGGTFVVTLSGSEREIVTAKSMVQQLFGTS